MELFQRLLHIVELFENNSQTQFAKRIGLSQQTCNNYLKFEGQQKIRKALLDKILTVYPQVNRDWLFFGEGEMLGQDRTSPGVSASVADQEMTLKEALEEIVRLNRENRELRQRLETADRITEVRNS